MRSEKWSESGFVVVDVRVDPSVLPPPLATHLRLLTSHFQAAAYPSLTVRLCSRMNCCTYHGPQPPLPLQPLPFQPQKACAPGQAPVVAPLRLLT